MTATAVSHERIIADAEAKLLSNEGHPIGAAIAYGEMLGAHTAKANNVLLDKFASGGNFTGGISDLSRLGTSVTEFVHPHDVLKAIAELASAYHRAEQKLPKTTANTELLERANTAIATEKKAAARIAKALFFEQKQAIEGFLADDKYKLVHEHLTAASEAAGKAINELDKILTAKSATKKR